jgi:NAD+ synthase (glutamine-hydrolysing)
MQAELSIGIAQLNYVVGDVWGNQQRVWHAAQQAYAQGVRLLIAPELALCGYPPEDLLLRPVFVQSCHDALQQLAQQLKALPGMQLVIGHPLQTAYGLVNAASCLANGHILATYAKQQLPNDQVFDEKRYFAAGDQPVVVPIEGVNGQKINVGLLICEDAWFAQPALAAQTEGAQVLVVLNASPFHSGKSAQRLQVMRQRSLQTHLPLVYAHMVGGQDELIFDGQSFALSAQGRVVARSPAFAEELSIWQLQINGSDGLCEVSGPICSVPDSFEHELWQALVLGVHDYVQKNGFSGVLLGLSGGIDSALVLAIAVDALGADRVRAVMMPSPYTADISWLDAREMAQRLGVRYQELDIKAHFEVFLSSLAADFEGLKPDATEENLQARIRGSLLMALSNKTGYMVLTTGNKSEMATGYCTLYGDMAGGFAVIKDVCKTDVFRLARWRNQHDVYATGANPIPDRILTRPPSAELRPDQTDQDSLPSYEVLDAIIKAHVEQNQSPAQMLASGLDAQAIEQVVRLIRINEYKRRQAPVGIRVTPRAFGKDWRMPLTQGYRDEPLTPLVVD